MNDKRVLFVTGGSRGIGKAMVQHFQANNWLVAACATTAQSAQQSGADLSIVCDVANKQQVQAAFASILQQYGRLDAVINNASIAGSNAMDNDDDSMWHQILDINLTGSFYISKYALPHLPDQSGRIVNIASVLGLKGVPDHIAYCAAKHGVVGLTKALSHYTAPRKITVNAICPGWVRTDMMQGRMDEMHLSENNLVAAIPLHRIIEPSEIAELAFYLIDNKAAMNITGQTFTIDGGVLA